METLYIQDMVKSRLLIMPSRVVPVAARGCLPPGANVFVAAPPPHPCGQISNCYSCGYNDGISVDCEQYAKLGV